ncbi:MAG: MtrB/PioB family decaheme-associated outer membrane protein, partial [Bradyrhizobium sp.]
LLPVFGFAFAEEPQGYISVGGGGWTNDRHQAGMYDGMRDKGFYPNADADLQKRDDDSGLTWGLKVRNLGLQTREIKGEVERQGDIGGSFEYNRIVKDNPFTIDTRLFRSGTREIVPAPSIVPGTGRDLELSVTRDRYTAKFYKSLADGLTFNASYRIENKDGNRQWGRGGAPDFAIEPINSTIRIWEGALNYATAKLQLSGGYYGTAYDNSNGLVVTSLSSGTAAQIAASTYNLTLPLDNQSHEVYLNGGYNFTPTTRGTFKASYQRATQNEFLPTARPGLVFPSGGAPIASAPHHLNGQLDTTLIEAGINSRPIQDLTVNATVRYRNLDDKTPLKLYANVTTGTGCSVANPCPVYNTPWSYKTLTGKADATYRLRDGYSLLGGIEFSSQDRWVPSKGTLYVPFRSDLDEWTARAGVRKAMSETVNGSLTYSYSNRDGGKYKKPGETLEPGENRINPINISDRKRNMVRGVVDWAPIDRLTLTLTGQYAHDDYSGLPDGLEKGKAYSVGLDGSYQLSQNWSFNAWVTFDQTKADETTLNVVSATAGVNPGKVQAIKDTTLKENGTSFGVGMRGAVQKLKLGADLERFRSHNKYNQDITVTIAGGGLSSSLVPVPDITNKMLKVKAFAEYPIQKNAEIRATFIYERWQTDDWTWMMFPPAGQQAFAYGVATGAVGTSSNTDGTTVFADQKQHSVFGGLRYIYRFE